MTTLPAIGQKITKGFEVIGVKQIVNHGPFYPNASIMAELFVVGARNATYKAVQYKNGVVEVMTKYGKSTPSFLGTVIYDGTKGAIIGN